MPSSAASSPQMLDADDQHRHRAAHGRAQADRHRRSISAAYGSPDPAARFPAIASPARSATAAWARSTPPKTTRRISRVAIKVLQVAADEALARFRAEAAIMERLDHPNIARVLARGDAMSRPYIVMEQIDGADARCLCRAAPPELRERLDAVRARSVTPSSMRIGAASCIAISSRRTSWCAHDGDVTIVDFGVARAGGASVARRVGDLPRHAALHEPRAGAGACRRSRCARRRVQPRRDPVRARRRRAAVRAAWTVVARRHANDSDGAAGNGYLIRSSMRCAHARSRRRRPIGSPRPPTSPPPFAPANEPDTGHRSLPAGSPTVSDMICV